MTRGRRSRYRILDTSVIIDGRVADIVETGFLDGTLVVPQFVLKELQFVADSSDPLKRNRGRRGLDILHRIQKMAGIEVIISDLDFPNIKEVDLKLIELARTMMGRIVTNDFNLNKVAQLRGVEVLNINELANGLKPVVLPGEAMNVFVIKEGKEYNQGVAYLDDGTMVVVDNARGRIGKNVDVIVTSVLQTTAGRMIFGRMAEAAAPAPAGAERAEGRAPAARVKSRAVIRVLPHKREPAAIPLVADRLLSHPRHRDLHDRARRRVARHAARSIVRPLRASVCAVVGQGDSLDDRRAREDGGGNLPPVSDSCIFVANHASYLRHPDDLRDAAAPVAAHGEGGARLRAVHRLAPAMDGASAGRSQEPGRVDFQTHAAPDDAGCVPAGVSRGIAHDRRPRRRSSRAASSCSRSRRAGPSCRSAIVGTRNVMPKGRLMTCPADVRLVVHDPIPTKGLSREDARGASPIACAPWWARSPSWD